MIENEEQLAATLGYMTKLIDALEGLRLGEEQKGNRIYAASASGFLQELRKNLDLAREFAEREAAQRPTTNGAYANGHTTVTPPTVSVEA